MERSLYRAGVSAARPFKDSEEQGSERLPSQAGLLFRALQGLRLPCFKAVFWDGKEFTTEGDEPHFEIRFHSPRALKRLLADLEMGFAEGYLDGSIEVRGDLAACLSLAFQAPEEQPGLSVSRKLALKLFRASRRNTLAGSRRNISAHYDLGNDFYRLWLDQDMVYTCAYYPEASLSLDQAQQAKMELVCRKLQLQPGQRVVEAGCGWGGFAIYAARHYGVSVRAFNISSAQIEVAREWARRENLVGQVEFVEDDYRNIRGNFDAFVSIGMLEHVGPENYSELGRLIERCLKKQGRGLLHFIGRSKPQPLDPWIFRYIFPGAHPPSLAEALPLLEERNMVVSDVENLRLHYAQTARHWLERFEEQREEVERLKGGIFARKWRLYLTGTYLAFLHGTLQLYQVTFSRGPSSREPLTREYLFDPRRGEVRRWNLTMPS